MADKYKISKVIIVGAGPSGLLLGILLAKQGIKVSLIEMSDKLDENPRAAHYAPSSVRELRRAGVLEEVTRDGLKPHGVCWRGPDREILAGIRGEVTNDPDAMVCLPLDKLDKILLRVFLEQESTEVLWKHKVVGIKQDEKEAQVQVETAEGEKWLGTDYVVGCDGANSQIRRSLFGDLAFPGETLQSQIIATNIYYDFPKFNYWDSQFIVHPTDWYMAAKITPGGLWRVTYGDEWGLSTEEYLKRQPERFEQILPGNPKPGDYKLVNISPYKLHQRCAESMRVGRFLLAADAAHLCNPLSSGGMGLTGGFADITTLYDCFLAMQEGLTDDSILDAYSDVRRKKWREIIDPSSRANFARIWDENAVEEKEAFFKMCRDMENDPEAQKRGAQVSNPATSDAEPRD
ncbi:FAD-dependent monooxygenase terC [Lachnellula suecica]|uniref:FAD-dependent monooxygenase terC n=1 Tax=Lachnellula suecica TaxID=602035 RepID=A0A8T9C9F1_9HELO|nr:FAD-dependent monooxygenase terC [Lachnellula suecica]